MRIVAFTGPEHLRGGQEPYVRGIVRQLDDVVGFVSGCAKGVDSVAGWEALMQFPEAEHDFIVPNNFRYNTEMIKVIENRKLSGKVRITYLSEGGPLDRNHWMADISTEVYAFPRTAKEILRSGTWSTIRYAKKIGNKVTMYPLDRSHPLVWDKEKWIKLEHP